MALWPLHWLCKLIGWNKKGGDDDNEILSSVSEPTRRFIRRLQVPPDQSPGRRKTLVYLLAAEALSEQSAADAAELVRAAKPGVVVAQIGPGILPGLKSEEDSSSNSDDSKIPTYALGVIRECFLDTTKRSSFETRAGIQVLRTIFGTTNHGHILSAKHAAREANATFFYLETPEPGRPPEPEPPGGDDLQGILVQRLGGLLLRGLGDSRYVKPTPECPGYATPFYSLLVELQSVYKDLPGMRRALESVRSLLFDVEQGKPVDQRTLTEARSFRLAVEGLRVALSDRPRAPQQKKQRSTPRSDRVQKLEELPPGEQVHLLLAQALQEQARSYGTMVAVVDAGSIAGICRHWDSRVSPEVAELARECFVYGHEEFEEDEDEDSDDDDDDDDEGSGEKKLRKKKKKLVVGGSVAAVGLAAMPWWVPVNAAGKAAVAKAAAAAHLKRGVAGKVAAVVVKAAKAGKARAAAHSVVAAAERAALSAVRTAVYGVIRRRQGMPCRGAAPWAVLGASVVAVGGIVWCGERLEAAIEAVPGAAGVARLGRGLQGLEAASERLSGGGSTTSVRAEE